VKNWSKSPLAFTAKFFDAQKAKSISLINAVFQAPEDLMHGAKQMAVEIAQNSFLAVQASKDVLNHGIGKSVEDGLKYVAAVSSKHRIFRSRRKFDNPCRRPQADPDIRMFGAMLHTVSGGPAETSGLTWPFPSVRIREAPLLHDGSSE
jgi:enoyl-CoA hydratase/carnithine racemase